MAKSQNAATITKAQLIKMIEDASDKGATKALARIGLHDEDAVHDVKELRNLLDGWRDTRKNVRATVVKVVTVAILGFIALASWSEFKDKL
tara:strand:- start:270 stop:542 length:273 start_codon:yes stop_codon:yes gene_type:complete